MTPTPVEPPTEFLASGATAVPSRHRWLAIAVCAAATMLVGWPALTGGFLVNPNSDQYLAGYAFREFAAQSLRSGQGFPQWNPYQFGGMPFVAAMHGDIFYPTFLLRLVLPTDVAMTWGFVLHIWLAGLFTVGFLRAVGVRFQASLVGGVAYLLSGAVASYPSPGHDGKLFVGALLPAALWAIVRGVRDGRARAWAALALVTGLAVLSPHPQLLQYLLLTSGAFALWLLWRPSSVVADDGPVPATPNRWKRIAPAFAAVCLGALIGAVQYLPVLEYVAWSPRGGGKGYEYATSFSLPPEELLNVYLPQFSGMLDRYWGRNGIHLHSEYLGASVLVLAAFSFGGGLTNRHRSHAWFWLVTFIISLLWALGGATPFYQLVYALIPGTKYFRAPSTILYISAFSTSVLAAFGAERLLSGRSSMRYALVWAGGAAVVVLLATAGAFTNLALSLTGGLRSDMINGNAPYVVAGAWRSALFVWATTAIVVLVARRATAGRVVGWALLGTVSFDLWTVARAYWRFSPPAASLYADDEIVRYLKRVREPARIIALPLGEDLASHDPFMLGSASMVHGIRNVLGYHGNELGRYQQLYGKSEGFQSVANPNFWALTNARFFFTNAPGLPFQGVRLVAGPVRNAAGTMSYLYELPGQHPFAWVAPMKVQLGDASTRATVLNPLFDVRRVAIFDSTARIESQPVNSPMPPPVPFGVRIDKYAPGSIDLELQGPAPAGSALVVAENYYPGWTAIVDGQSVPTARADFTLIGVELPTGARKVRLRFASAPYETGKLLTILALGATALWAVLGWAQDRRQPVP